MQTLGSSHLCASPISSGEGSSRTRSAILFVFALLGALSLRRSSWLQSSLVLQWCMVIRDAQKEQEKTRPIRRCSRESGGHLLCGVQEDVETWIHCHTHGRAWLCQMCLGFVFLSTQCVGSPAAECRSSQCVGRQSTCSANRCRMEKCEPQAKTSCCNCSQGRAEARGLVCSDLFRCGRSTLWSARDCAGFDYRSKAGDGGAELHLRDGNSEF